LAFSHKHDKKLFWQMALSQQKINMANFTPHIGKISKVKFVAECGQN